MRFWDSSAIVPLLVKESASPKVHSLYKNDSDMLAWWSTGVECASAISRMEREGTLDADSVGSAFRRLKELQRDWQEIQPIEVLRKHAIRLLRVHPISSADALQLAAAILASENQPSSLDFVCLDARLAMIAEREGFNVLSG